MEMVQIVVDIWRGKNFIGVERKSLFQAKLSCDPYIQVKYGELCLRTKVIRNNLEPGRL